MAGGDRAAVLIHARVVVGDPVVVEEGEHLDGERLVELEEADVLDRQAGERERLLGRGDRADPHDLGLDADEAIADEPHSHGQVELGGQVVPALIALRETGLEAIQLGRAGMGA